MPQRRTSFKALRVSAKAHTRNLDARTDLRKTIKKFLALVSEKKVQEAKSALQIVYKKLDKAVKRHILHKNTASRRKSRFSRMLQKTA